MVIGLNIVTVVATHIGVVLTVVLEAHVTSVLRIRIVEVAINVAVVRA